MFFFFSSRRRHTRCYRDWSSDVCSSDLRHQAARLDAGRVPLRRRRTADRTRILTVVAVPLEPDGKVFRWVLGFERGWRCVVDPIAVAAVGRWSGGPAASHDHDGGPVDHRFVVLGSAFVVADQPPVAQQPTEATFHHPPARGTTRKACNSVRLMTVSVICATAWTQPAKGVPS